MDEINPFMVAQGKAAQATRMAGQSWNYLNQNDPQYIELNLYRAMPHPNARVLSVEETRDALIATLPHADSPDLAESPTVKGKLSEEDTKNE